MKLSNIKLVNIKNTSRFTVLLFIALAIVVHSSIIAQIPSTNFANQFGSTGTDDGWGVGSDALGNIYMCGGFNGAVTFGSTTLTSSYGRDMYLVKLDSAGTVQWAKKGGGSYASERGRAMAVDSAGNSYVCGYFYTSATFGSTTITSHGGYDVFIAKYNSSGVVQWVKNAGSTADDDEAFDIEVDNNGNCFVVGYFIGTATFASGTTLTSSGLKDGYIAKYNSAGVFQWVKQVAGTSNNYGYGCAVDSLGNVAITGSFQGTAAFSSTTSLTSSGLADIFIAKYNGSTGALMFASNAGGTGWDEARGMGNDPQGNFYITGYYAGTSTFGAGASSSSITSVTELYGSSPSDDIFLAKYSNSGSFEWVNSAGGGRDEGGRDIACDNFGNVNVVGFFEGDATFGTYTLINTAPGPNFAYEDPFAAQYDSSGSFNWVTHGGSGWHDAAYGVDVDPWGNILVSGTLNPDGVTRNWNGMSFNGSTSSNNGDDIFLVKMGNQSGPPPLSVSISKNDISCNGLSDGTATIIAAGGAFSYTYAWSTGDTSTLINNLSAGTYFVTITDSLNAIVIDSIVIVDPLVISDSITASNVSCYGSIDGVINMSVTGGSSPYSFTWSNGDSTQNISGLNVGQYVVTITDANNCASVDTVHITQPISPISNQLIGQDINCNGGNDGNISASVTGGTVPYMFAWSNGGTTQVANNLTANQYYVTITDANNCTSIDSISLTEPASAMSIQNINITNISCFNYTDGTINFNTSGGTAPYTYNWSNGNTTQGLSGVSSGSYMVTISDSLNCIFLDTMDITQPDSALLAQIFSSAETPALSDGTVWVNVTGGTPGYNYLWNDPTQQTSDTAINLSSGTYQVVFTDANGCQDSLNIEVMDSTNVGVSEINHKLKSVVYPNPSNGAFTVSVLETGHLEIINMTGKVVYQANSQGKNNLNIELNESAGIYILRVNYNDKVQTTPIIIE